MQRVFGRVKAMRDKSSRDFARLQRVCANGFETQLWQQLRNRQRCGKKFRRQHPLGPYTADFYCVEARLVVEVDGAHHFTEAGKEHDQVRDSWMREQSIVVLRVTGYQVEQEMPSVLARIDEKLVGRCGAESSLPGADGPSPPAPLPAKPGRGEPEK